MTLIVYSVIYTLCDDILKNELDNIYPTVESAIKCAKRIGKLKSCFEVHVNEDLVDESGRHFKREMYSEKHNEHYDNYYKL